MPCDHLVAMSVHESLKVVRQTSLDQAVLTQNVQRGLHAFPNLGPGRLVRGAHERAREIGFKALLIDDGLHVHVTPLPGWLLSSKDVIDPGVGRSEERRVGKGW